MTTSDVEKIQCVCRRLRCVPIGRYTKVVSLIAVFAIGCETSGNGPGGFGGNSDSGGSSQTGGTSSGEGLCCKDNASGSCDCKPIQCGLSAVGGSCVCGRDMHISNELESCSDTAAMCCYTDTGYCYCEDGCDQRFGSYFNGTSCEPSDYSINCGGMYSGLVEVDSCQ